MFISLWDNEYGRNIENFLSYFSEQLFLRTVNCEFSLVISDFIITEIKRKMELSEEEMQQRLSKYKHLGKLEIYTLTSEDWNEAHELMRTVKTHLTDAIQLIAARKSKAELLVTWNLKDFDSAENIITVISPKYL